MTTIIDGSLGVTFPDVSTQATAGLTKANPTISSGVLTFPDATTQASGSGVAKAWVRFNGVTGAILGSYNVSSITRISTGYYTINMTNALANANYAIAGSSRDTATNGLCVVVNTADLSAPTTSAFRIQTIGGSSFTTIDSPYNSVIVLD